MTSRETARSSEKPGEALVGRLALFVAAAAFVVAAGAQATVEGRALTALFGAVLVELARRDLRDRIIPNRVVYPALCSALLLSFLWPGHGLGSSLAGMFVGGALMAAVFVASRGGLGAGDVKMAALVGAVVGFPGVLAALVVTSLVGGAAALYLLARGDHPEDFAYAPFLALGAAIQLLAMSPSRA